MTPPTDLPVDQPAGPAGDLAPEPVTRPTLDDDAALIALADLDPVTAAGLEAMLFLADEPVDVDSLGEVLDVHPDAVDAACQGLAVRHRRERRGTEVRRAAGGWRMYSAALARPALERWALTGRTGRLTQAALETLAVVVYKQPISRTEIGEIRGVNADAAVRSLVARGLVTEVGRDDGPGQAVRYGTTTMLLERLGIDSLDELPPLTDFLPEHAAPDEPDLARLKEVRRQLASGDDLGAGAAGGTDAPADPTRDAAIRRLADVRARLAAAGADPADAQAPAPGGGDLPASGDDLPASGDDLATPVDDDVLPPPVATRATRQADGAAMDALSDRLESAARSAVAQLRRAVEASAERDRADGVTDHDAADTAADDKAADTAADDEAADTAADDETAEAADGSDADA